MLAYDVWHGKLLLGGQLKAPYSLIAEQTIVQGFQHLEVLFQERFISFS